MTPPARGPSRGALLVPNLAAEEGPGWRDRARAPAVRSVAGLWRGLFGDGAQIAAGVRPARTPASLLAPDPAFPWLGGEGAAFAWLNTGEARDLAERAGRRLYGAAPEIVERVHDKAFARRVSLEEDLEPRSLRGASASFEPALLADPEATRAEIRAVVSSWPAWARGHFTLKPRFGSSGRGRVAGRQDALDDPTLAGALPRLAARGGALLEPWLERAADYASQLLVQDDGSVLLLGTLEQVVAPSGLYLGHRGDLDARGRVHAGGPFDEALREPAVTVARRAAEQGYRGPCGVDAFAFAAPDGRPELRPVVELNARFSVGTVVVGLLRRLLPALRERIGLPPERRRAFFFALRPPPGGWPLPEPGAPLALVPLVADEADASGGPALLVAEDRAGLDAALAAGARS